MDTTKNMTFPPACTYHGLDKQRRARVVLDGQRYLVSGKVFKRKSYTDSEGATKWSRKLIAATPAVEETCLKPKSVIAVSRKTCDSYRIIGIFHPVGKPMKASENASVRPVVAEASTSASTPTVAPSSQVKVAKLKPSILHQLANLSALRARGLDPDMRIAQIVEYVQESRATLYRKMGREFPKPIKRGKGSFWPMSVIEAYKAGKYHGRVVG